MGGSQRNKGKRGELEVCKLLRKSLPDHTVERFGTGESGHDVRVLTPDGDPWRYAVEVKRYADYGIGETMRGSTRWADWWAQAVEQAQRVERNPLLFCRGDRRPWWVFATYTPDWVDRLPTTCLVLADGYPVIGAPWSERLGRMLLEER